ncbi:uncharacterized protein LOC126260607 [Schistocerca nitens]|uniref:uncharacterized protein LOC126260607 n=1 Tax=Schistocerca nitens TaxID=7011 RepID=UPI002118E37A|nr:uncharacterized protein LOC126260607 [Schistocerca nitens]
MSSSAEQVLYVSDEKWNEFYSTPLHHYEHSCPVREIRKVVNHCQNGSTPRLKLPPNLIRLSIRENMYPTALKMSVVKPVYKKGRKEDVSSYRPISLIPTFSKIFESIILSQLWLQKRAKYNHNSYTVHP